MIAFLMFWLVSIILIIILRILNRLRISNRIIKHFFEFIHLLFFWGIIEAHYLVFSFLSEPPLFMLQEFFPNLSDNMYIRVSSAVLFVVLILFCRPKPTLMGNRDRLEW